MRRPGFSFFHSVIGVLVTLVLLGTAGLARPALSRYANRHHSDPSEPSHCR